MDDYSPAKNLMTMCFTYYYTGKISLHLLPSSTVSDLSFYACIAQIQCENERTVVELSSAA